MEESAKSESPPKFQASLIVLAKSPNSVRSTISFLNRRGIPARVATTLNEAIEALSNKSANLVLLSMSFPHPKIDMMPGLFAQSFSVDCILFAEDNDRKTQKRLADARTKHVLFGPVSGPVVMMRVRQIEKALNGDDEVQSSSVERASIERNDSGEIKVGGSKNGSDADQIVLKGQRGTSSDESIANNSLQRTGNGTIVQKGTRSKLHSTHRKGFGVRRERKMSAAELREAIERGLISAEPDEVPPLIQADRTSQIDPDELQARKAELLRALSEGSPSESEESSSDEELSADELLAKEKALAAEAAALAEAERREKQEKARAENEAKAAERKAREEERKAQAEERKAQAEERKAQAEVRAKEQKERREHEAKLRDEKVREIAEEKAKAEREKAVALAADRAEQSRKEQEEKEKKRIEKEAAARETATREAEAKAKTEAETKAKEKQDSEFEAAKKEAAKVEAARKTEEKKKAAEKVAAEKKAADKNVATTAKEAHSDTNSEKKDAAINRFDPKAKTKDLAAKDTTSNEATKAEAKKAAEAKGSAKPVSETSSAEERERSEQAAKDARQASTKKPREARIHDALEQAEVDPKERNSRSDSQNGKANEASQSPVDIAKIREVKVGVSSQLAEEEIERQRQFHEEHPLYRFMHEAITTVCGTGSKTTMGAMSSCSGAGLVSVRSGSLQGNFLIVVGSSRTRSSDLISRIEVAFFSILRKHGHELLDGEQFAIGLDDFKMVERAFSGADFHEITRAGGHEVGVAPVVLLNPVPEMIPHGSDMLQVKLGDIAPDYPVSFDVFLYLQLNQKYLRYLKNGSAMTSRQFTRLETSKVEHVYLNEKDQHAYRRHYAAQSIQPSPRRQKKAA